MAAVLKRESEERQKAQLAAAQAQAAQQQQLAEQARQAAELLRQQQAQEVQRQQQEAAAKQLLQQQQQQAQQAAQQKAEAMKRQQEAAQVMEQQQRQAAQAQQDAVVKQQQAAAQAAQQLSGISLGGPPNTAPNPAATITPSSGKDETERYLNALNDSFLQMPSNTETERSKSYTPRNPYPAAPASYPTVPSPIFDNPAVFEKLGTDALFFIFYYAQGTYQQFLAARELKKQSWRYHKKYMTWFQRHEEPKVTTDDYEQGTYVYFDYETGWCQRIKSDFRFEYSFLEDSLSI